MNVPALMTDTVRFGEYLHEQIPGLPSQKRSRELCLTLDRTLESVEESLEVLRARSLRIAVAG